jgi:Mycothiol maleylpyruvate isomerase N-terminal domain
MLEARWLAGDPLNWPLVRAIRASYLAAADVAVRLLGDTAVAQRWAAPTVLPGMPVSALAGHLARQVFGVERLLAAGPGAEPPISILDHYARSAWAAAGPDDEANVGIRRDAAAEAARGPAALAARAADTARRLSGVLAGEPPDRVVLVPWGPWPLTLDDLLVSRLLEIAVHDDDLALSVGLPTPELPGDVTDLVLALLSRLAARRHGATAVIRALSRAERAPPTIAAF